jgi:hypothetical protein
MAQPRVLQIGIPLTMLNGIVYAMPIKQTEVYVNSTTANFQTNIVNSTTGWQTLSTANLSFETTAPFIKTTETTLAIIAKAL